MSSYNSKHFGISIIIAFLFIILLVVPLSTAKGPSINKNIRIASKVLEEVDEGKTINVLVSLKEEVSAKSFKTSEFANKRLIKDKYFVTKVDKKELGELSNNPEIERIYYRHNFGIFLQDSVPLINATTVHTLKTTLGINITGKGQSVCILDTGVNYTHPDLGSGWGNKVIAGWRYTNNTMSINCTDNNSACKDDHNYGGKHGHGTHVAGIVAANGTINGVAPEANIVVIKVLNYTGFGTEEDIAKGIEWCTNYSDRYNISVISMSIGTSSYHNDTFCDADFPILALAIDNARANNLSVVIATGNEANFNEISSPACVANATRVCATTKADGFYSSGNRGGSFTDILLAPGVSINSTDYTGSYELKTGTSMAAPHVSGAIALLFQYKEQEESDTLLPTEIINILNSTGLILDDSDSGKNYSRIDVYAALVSIDNTSPAINITYPINGSIYTSLDNYSLNFTISEVNLNTSSCKYSINNGSNVSIPSCFNTTINISSTGDYNLTLYATDKSNNTNSSIIYFEVNEVPSITLVSPQNGSVFEPGDLINFTITDSDNISVAIYNGTQDGNLTNTSNDTWYINTSGWNTGEHNLTITANDTLNNTVNNSYVFYLDYAPNLTFWSWYYNDTYRSNSTNITYENITCPENGTVLFNITANDTDAFPNLTYIWYVDGINLSNETEWNYTPGLHDAGLHNVSLTISDSKMNTSEAWNFTILDPWSPNFTLENKSLNEDTLLTYDIDAIDVDGDNLTYYDNSVDFNIDPSTGLISWTPATPGTYNVVITVSDGSNNVSKAFVITVNDVVEDTGGSRSSSAGGGGITITSSQPSKTQIFSQISPDTESQMNIDSVDIPVSKLAITSSELLKTVEVTVSSLEEKPESVSSAPHKSYEYFSITSSSNEIKGKINFKVNKSWIKENNIDSNKVYLLRYENDWEKLETRRSGEDTNYLYYSAEIPGFSYFVISGEELVEESQAINISEGDSNITEVVEELDKTEELEDKETRDEDYEGIGIYIIIIVALVIIIFLEFYIRRRKQ